jgi:hypothetical protein
MKIHKVDNSNSNEQDQFHVLSSPESLYLTVNCITVPPGSCYMASPIVHPSGAPWLGKSSSIGTSPVNNTLVGKGEDTFLASLCPIDSSAGSKASSGGALGSLTGGATVTPVASHMVAKGISSSGTPRLSKPASCGAGGIGHTSIGEREDTRQANFGTTICQTGCSGSCCHG